MSPLKSLSVDDEYKLRCLLGVSEQIEQTKLFTLDNILKAILSLFLVFQDRVWATAL